MSTADSKPQHDLLNQFRRHRTRVSVVLLNGEQLDGTIDSFDLYSISLRCPDPHLIVKTNIATVRPAPKAAPIRKPRDPYTSAVAHRPATNAPIIERKKRRLLSDRT